LDDADLLERAHHAYRRWCARNSIICCQPSSTTSSVLDVDGATLVVLANKTGIPDDVIASYEVCVAPGRRPRLKRLDREKLESLLRR
jgi:hypothetical protein